MCIMELMDFIFHIIEIQYVRLNSANSRIDNGNDLFIFIQHMHIFILSSQI